MEIEADNVYSIDEIKNIYQRTTDQEMNPILDNKNFNNNYSNLILKDLYKINQEDIKKQNIDVHELIS
jgi:hypothetical protein